MNTALRTERVTPPGSLITYDDGESASSDIGWVNVRSTVFGAEVAALASFGKPPTPWNSAWAGGRLEPDGSVRALVVVTRYRPGPWVAVVSSTTVRWPPTKAPPVIASVPMTLPAV